MIILPEWSMYIGFAILIFFTIKSHQAGDFEGRESPTILPPMSIWGKLMIASIIIGMILVMTGIVKFEG